MKIIFFKNETHFYPRVSYTWENAERVDVVSPLEKFYSAFSIAISIISYILVINKFSYKFKEKNEFILGSLVLLLVLSVILTSASILALTKDEIEERMNYLQEHNKPIVLNRKKGQAFNSVFGLSRKKYRDLIEKEKNVISEITE